MDATLPPNRPAARVPAGDRARRPLERSELLLTLTTLPLQDPQAYVQVMAETISRGMDVDRADVMVRDAAGEALRSLGAGGDLRTDVGEGGLRHVPLTTPSPLAEVFRTGVPYRVDDVRNDPAAPPGFAAIGLCALLAVPLVVAGERRGVVYLAGRQPGIFGLEDQALLLIVAARVGLLIEHAALARRRGEIERAEAHQQARHEFLGLVSHELKTPVAVIKAYTEALAHRAAREGDAEGARILERVEEQATRMLALIEDLLDLQRLQMSPLALEPSRFNLAALAQRVAEELQTTAPHHRIRIIVHTAAPAMVRADRRRIEQVLVNLIENAIKYSAQGSAITVTIQRKPREDDAGEQVVLAVADQGIGIAAADLPHIFNRFYQAGGGRLHRGLRGLGIGLYIAREIAERHGGTLRVTSVPDVGSTFYLSLPLDG